MNTFKGYATKWALAKGIIELELVETDTPGIVACPENKYLCYFHGEGREWHRTKTAAAHWANAMRLAKIKNLERQITKLKQLKFE